MHMFRTNTINLIISVLGPAREGNDIADVLHAGDEHDETLESKSESWMRDGSVATQVEVPLERALGHVHLLDTSLEHVEMLLALRSSDELSDLGDEDIHGRGRSFRPR